MTDLLPVVIAALVGALVAAPIAASRARRRARAETDAAVRARLADVAASLRVHPGEPPGILSDPPPDTEEIRSALSDGWVLKGHEREEAVEAALRRLSAFLKVAVEGPLNRALAVDSESVRDGVEDALGAIDDLEFFLEPPPEGGGPTDLRQALLDVVAEFREAWPNQRVRERISEGAFTARMNPEAFKDAVYLVLHNAVVFGDGGPIDVVLEEKGHEALVMVRDKGPGFSADALLSALDPFYSTSEGGLGMGLPQAKRLIEGQGGALRFRNMRKGGAEVTLAMPKVG